MSIGTDSEAGKSGSMVINGQVVPATVTNVKSALGVGTAYQFNASWGPVILNGQVFSFRQNQVANFTPLEYAYFSGLGAPISAV